MKKQDLISQVILDTKNYVISVELFRYALAKLLHINATDMECLSILYHKGVATPSELSKYTSLGSGATTAMLDRLERKGLIERRPNPQDGRGTYVAVTQETIEKITPLFNSFNKAEQTLISGYSKQELELIQGFISKEIEIWDKEREKLTTERI